MSDARYATVAAEGAHADCVPGRNTYELRLRDGRGRIIVLCEQRFDDPSRSIRRALSVFEG